MIGKVIGTLILGSGLGIPISATLRKTIVSERIPRILETSDSIVKLEWEKEGSHEEIGKLIDNLGEIINKPNGSHLTTNSNDSRKAKVLAVRLTTKGAFDDNVCRKLGFDPGLKEPPINLQLNEKAKDDDIKGIGCYTNLDI